MQNLERYYGFSAEVTTLLEPERLEQIRTDAVPILQFKGYNPAEYHIYCHQLRIKENPKHWAAAIPLHQRIEMLRLTFRVNPKQRQSGSIMFLNWRFGMSVEQQLGLLSSDVAMEGGSWDIHYNIMREFVQGRTTFQNAIVTFVRRDVKPDHRKIKIELVASPTHAYESRLKRQQVSAETRLDLRLRKPTGWNATLLAPPRRKKVASQPGGTAYVLTQLRRIEERLQQERSASVQLPPQTSLFAPEVSPASPAPGLERRRLARIEKLESRYAEALRRLVGTPLNEGEAHAILASVDQLLSRYEQQLRAAGNPRLVEVLDQRHLLSDPGRPIGSRLKLAIPVIPLLLHYEVELSPDGTFKDAWQRIKRLFGRGRSRPRSIRDPLN